MLLNTEPPRHKRAISLTPLIDVVFILLLFFMLSSTFIQWRQIDVSAPSESQAESREQRVVTLVSNDGTYKIGNMTLSLKDANSVATVVNQDPDAVYVIEVKSGIQTQSMIDLLDAFKQAGAKSVSLAGIN
ncbi:MULTISPECIES: ExbD/TolR family protein [unclassified Methylophaga]|jgi:biopolymer transport protein ExbD|uniref:ExbD/TolR family protein n=1 Tax=unclassified Methylophaga TaxID=2629249 RepID=UPI00259C8B3E|nr:MULTISPECIES: biopolymer transporter ExbD [unclassified Methylophaga]|tara:strand:+ start:1398 stop:1790 length:393 start_codon:yes stop_codon:yes gene_type:complete